MKHRKISLFSFLKTGILLISIISLFSISRAQESHATLSWEQSAGGENYRTGSHIPVVKYRVGGEVKSANVTGNPGFVTMEVQSVRKNGKKRKNKGALIHFNLNEKKVNWTRDLHFRKNRSMKLGNTIFLWEEGLMYRLDMETGENKYGVDYDLFYIDPWSTIAVGYPPGYYSKLEGIDLQNGITLWHREISNEYGWNDAFFLNDSVLLVLASGLHTVNIHNGNGWDYEAVTGYYKFDGQLIYDAISNLLEDDLYYYFATHDKIAKIAKETGRVQWNYYFYKKKGSRSYIFGDGARIYMINTGSAKSGNSIVASSSPFLAAFDAKTAVQYYETRLLMKNGLMKDYSLNGEKLFILYNRAVSLLDIRKGKRKGNFRYFQRKAGVFTRFVNDHYVKEGDRMDLLSDKYPEKLFIETDKGLLISLDTDGNFNALQSATDLYEKFYETEEIVVLANDKNMLFFDKEGICIGEINAGKNSILSGTKLYDMSGNDILEFDISSFFHIPE